MNRVQVEDRAYFPVAEKTKMLAKSRRVCAHCGIKINEDTISVEHVIPISKGGTNKSYNVVALCKKCNKLKDNRVINPSKWYPFLLPEYRQELETYWKTYCKSFEYIFEEDFFVQSFIQETLNNRKIKMSPKARLLAFQNQKTIVRLTTNNIVEMCIFLKSFAKRNLDMDDLEVSTRRVGAILHHMVYGVKAGNNYSGLFIIKNCGSNCAMWLFPNYESSYVELLNMLRKSLSRMLDSNYKYVFVNYLDNDRGLNDCFKSCGIFSISSGTPGCNCVRLDNNSNSLNQFIERITDIIERHALRFVAYSDRGYKI